MSQKSVYEAVAETVCNAMIDVDNSLHDYLYMNQEKLAELVKYYWILILDFNEAPLTLAELPNLGLCDQGHSLLKPFYERTAQPMDYTHPRIAAFYTVLAGETEHAWVLDRAKHDIVLTTDQLTYVKNYVYGLAIEWHTSHAGNLNTSVVRISETAEAALRLVISDLTDGLLDRPRTEFEESAVVKAKALAYGLYTPSIYKKFRSA